MSQCEKTTEQECEVGQSHSRACAFRAMPSPTDLCTHTDTRLLNVHAITPNNVCVLPSLTIQLVGEG